MDFVRNTQYAGRFANIVSRVLDNVEALIVQVVYDGEVNANESTFTVGTLARYGLDNGEG